MSEEKKPPATLKQLLASIIEQRKTPRLEGDDFAAVQAWLAARLDSETTLALGLELERGPNGFVARAWVEPLDRSRSPHFSGEVTHRRELRPMALWEALLDACALCEDRESYDG